MLALDPAHKEALGVVAFFLCILAALRVQKGVAQSRNVDRRCKEDLERVRREQRRMTQEAVGRMDAFLEEATLQSNPSESLSIQDSETPNPQPPMRSNKITPEHITRLLDQTTHVSSKLGDCTTVVLATLPNGFEILESSACVDPANYDQKIGTELALEKVRRRVWMLEGYALQEELHSGQLLSSQNPEVPSARLNYAAVPVEKMVHLAVPGTGFHPGKLVYRVGDLTADEARAQSEREAAEARSMELGAFLQDAKPMVDDADEYRIRWQQERERFLYEAIDIVRGVEPDAPGPEPSEDEGEE